MREKGYDTLDTQKASAKQSQFPHGQQWARAGKAAGAAGGTHRAKQSQFADGRVRSAYGSGSAGLTMASTAATLMW